MNLEWTEWAMHQVCAIAQMDRDYKELVHVREGQELIFSKIMEKLSPEERMSVEDYISSCENLEYMKGIFAYEFGKQVGRTQSILTIR